jgi:hypothetical protein
MNIISHRIRKTKIHLRPPYASATVSSSSSSGVFEFDLYYYQLFNAWHRVPNVPGRSTTPQPIQILLLLLLVRHCPYSVEIEIHLRESPSWSVEAVRALYSSSTGVRTCRGQTERGGPTRQSDKSLAGVLHRTLPACGIGTAYCSSTGATARLVVRWPCVLLVIHALLQCSLTGPIY